MRINGVEFDRTELDGWMAYMRSRGRKQTTIHTHECNVRQCLAYLTVDGRPTAAAGITAEDIQYLWMTMEAKQETRKCYLRSLALMVIHYTGVDIVKQAGLLYNREVRDRVFIDETEFRTLYNRADERERLILSLGAYMGLRRNEMLRIRDGDIVGDRLVVHGKGHGEDGLVMTVQIPAPVRKAMEDYIATKRGRRRDDDHLIQTVGHDGHLHTMVPQALSTLVSNLGKRCGIRVTTHSLRRFCATTLYYTVRCDLTTLREVMRHADVSTTLKCYVDAYREKEREATDALTDHLSGIISG